MKRDGRLMAAMVFGILLCGAMTGQAAKQKPTEPPVFRLARIFTDHMVLQQGKPIVVWGWARPGARVSVTLTQDPAVGAKALPPLEQPADDGAYRVTVQYVEKNPPRLPTRSLTATADARGRWEVRFPPAKASFQPTWLIARSGEQTIGIQDVLIGEIWLCAGQSNMAWSNFNRKDREAASADFPGLRYVAWNDSWYKPLDDVRHNLQWTVCSPQTAQRFSAVPYLFGMFLHRYLKVPVGIINVARGGTLGQTWCLREELDNIDNQIIRTILKDYDAQTATWDDPAQVQRIKAQWQKAVEQAKAEHAEKVAQARAAGKPAPRLRLPKEPGDPRSGWSPPAGLFNATVMPIRHLRIGGVLYYQGENQAFNRWTQYEYTFPKIPVSFRKAFGEPDLPFGCISQPGWGTFGEEPEVSAARGGYHIVRDIQRRALKDDPHAGLIATYPTGNSYIHPAEKLPVAEYASLWALARVYHKPVVHRANQYQRMVVRDGKAYLFFDTDPMVAEQWKHVEDKAYWMVLPCPREGNAPFLGFTIAGADRRWYPARARHAKLDGQWCIEVSSDLVDDPVAVRYGWAQWPTGNLVGRGRLPLPTFRTDDWPLPVGLSHTRQAQEQTRATLARMQAVAQQQALDRKIRQMLIDLPELERQLYMPKGQNNLKGLVLSKIDRMQAVLDQLAGEPQLQRLLRQDKALARRLETAGKAVAELREQARRLP